MKRLAAMQLWPHVEAARGDGRGYGFCEVRIGEHDKRVRAAQLQHHRLDCSTCRSTHSLASCFAASERGPSDAGIRDQRSDRVDVYEQGPK